MPLHRFDGTWFRETHNQEIPSGSSCASETVHPIAANARKCPAAKLPHPPKTSEDQGRLTVNQSLANRLNYGELVRAQETRFVGLILLAKVGGLCDNRTKPLSALVLG
jgi:hypothetical protein